MPYVVTTPEWLELDGVPLSTPGWWTPSLDDLLSSPVMRTTDLVIPGAAGVRPGPIRPTVTGATVDLVVVGDVDGEGEAHADPAAGLTANIEHLRANVADPPVDEPDSTRLATLHLAGGVTRTGRVHVVRLRLSRIALDCAVGQLELSIPAGALT